jgi:hypothetical protein
MLVYYALFVYLYKLLQFLLFDATYRVLLFTVLGHTLFSVPEAVV